MKWLSAVALLATLAVAGPSRPADANPFEYSWEQLAPGVWGAIRKDPFELPQEGNAVLVVTGQGVVAFDAGGSPAMGEAIVAKARALTDQPITHVVLSHWHGDHMRGLQAIQAAFPQVQIIAHPHTRAWIDGTRDRWLKRRVSMAPNIRKMLDGAMAKNVDLSGRPLGPEERTWLEHGASIVDQLDRENNRTAYVIPNVTVTDSLTLYLGSRTIRFFHPGRAHTAGDLVMWLPEEGIVATGDIVTGPIPLMQSPYTRDYVGVLEQIKGLHYQALVPGHGPVERDTQYLDLLVETLQNVSGQMKALVAKGLARADAVAQVDWSALAPRFTHGDPFLTNRFRDYLSQTMPDAAFSAESGKDPDEMF